MNTSTWVPLVTAGAGLIAGLLAGLGSTVLARRWSREDRRAAWQREDRLRWQADRLQAYTRLISALDVWDVEMRRAVKQREDEPFDAAGWERQARTVMELVVLVGLTAPDEVRDLALDCNSAFRRIERMLADGDADPAAILAESAGPVRATSRLMEAMRADLGLGVGGQALSSQGQRAPGGRRR
jgi:hypothetical protein